jgi:predicted permease
MTVPVLLFSAALLCLFLALSSNFVARALTHWNPSSWVETVQGIFFLFMIASSLALLCSAIGIFISNMVRDTQRTLTSPFLVPILLLVGIGLYRLRTKRTVLYGLFECSFAIAGIAFSVHTASNDSLSKLLSLAGGVYIIVRGLDNIDKGLTPLRRVRWALFFPSRTQT